MNAIADTSTAHPLGRVFGLSNEEYHSGPGISKSQLDDIAESPATYIWRKSAPVDEEKLKALDMGTALHCLLHNIAQRFAASREQHLAVPAVLDLESLHLRLPVRCRWDLL